MDCMLCLCLPTRRRFPLTLATLHVVRFTAMCRYIHRQFAQLWIAAATSNESSLTSGSEPRPGPSSAKMGSTQPMEVDFDDNDDDGAEQIRIAQGWKGKNKAQPTRRHPAGSSAATQTVTIATTIRSVNMMYSLRSTVGRTHAT